MLVVRKEQMAAFEQSLFRRWVMDHLRRFFPAQCERLGPKGLIELVDHGVAHAREHGFHAERDVCRYLDIMVVFGRTFDRDLPWAKEILEDARLVLPGMRMDLLHDVAVEHEGSLTV